MSQSAPARLPSGLVYAPPRDPWIDVVHEDADILVLNKPSGLLHVPGKDPALADSLQTRVLARYPGAGTVHRLDKDTSGVVVMAKSKWIHGRLGIQFEKRVTQKRYVAQVWGALVGEAGLVDLPLATDWERKPRQRIDFERGRVAQTRWCVRTRGEETTRLDLVPLTGRTHQLRVHMLALGHPILGDSFYAQGPALQAASRLNLHAQSLSFYHPATSAWLTFESAVPF